MLPNSIMRVMWAINVIGVFCYLGVLLGRVVVDLPLWFQVASFLLSLFVSLVYLPKIIAPFRRVSP